MGDGWRFPRFRSFSTKASCLSLNPFKFACPPCVFERCSYHRGLGWHNLSHQLDTEEGRDRNVNWFVVWHIQLWTFEYVCLVKRVSTSGRTFKTNMAKRTAGPSLVCYISKYIFFPKVYGFKRFFLATFHWSTLKLLDVGRSGFASGIKPANWVKRKIFYERRCQQKSYLVTTSRLMSRWLVVLCCWEMVEVESDGNSDHPDNTWRYCNQFWLMLKCVVKRS